MGPQAGRQRALPPRVVGDEPERPARPPRRSRQRRRALGRDRLPRDPRRHSRLPGRARAASSTSSASAATRRRTRTLRPITVAALPDRSGSPQFMEALLLWNCRNPFLADPRVRRALAHAWPREEMVRRLYPPDGAALVAGPIRRACPRIRRTSRRPSYDPAGARAAARRGGLEARGGTASAARAGKRRRSRCCTRRARRSTPPSARSSAPLTRRSGSSSSCVRSNGRRSRSARGKGEFDVQFAGNVFFPPNIDPYPYYHSSQWPPSGENIGFYKDAEADRLMEAARDELDASKRLDLYRQVALRMADESARRLHFRRRPVLGDGEASRGRGHLSDRPLPLPAGTARLASRARREPVSLPLEGVLVLDLSRVLAGPYCTMMLGDLGARVIKVEHPEGGDVTRGWGPPYHPPTRLSAYYLSINRNKESIALDLATAAGAEVGPPSGRARRRARRELPAGRPREVPAFARGAAPRESATRHRIDHRIRPDGPGVLGSRLRPARPGGSRSDGDHGARRRRAHEGPASRSPTSSRAATQRSGSWPLWPVASARTRAVTSRSTSSRPRSRR